MVNEKPQDSKQTTSNTVTPTPTIYFILPCFNESETLPTTATAMLAKFGSLIQRHMISSNSRVTFVDDGSKDDTWGIIKELHARHTTIFRGIKLSHNRGHQNALLAGLMFALQEGCDASISMDADLQDDISAVDQFIEHFNNGDEIVYGVRSTRETDTWFKRSTASLFYSIFEWSGAETIQNHADYRLMSRQALSALSEYQEVNLFLRGIVPTLGFRTSKVYYARKEREAGVSKYPLKKMISFAIQGITSFSTKPLSFVTITGAISVLIGIGMFIYVFVSFVTGNPMSGWGSLMCSLWLIGGLIMLSLGIVGEYVGKIYMESKRRPRYLIEQEL